MRFPFHRVVLGLASLLVIPACGSSSGGVAPAATPSPVARFAYVANNDGSVSVYRVNPVLGQLLPNGFAAAYAGAAPATNQQVSMSPGGGACWIVTPGAP
ncbi:MAG TPA: hypothetical protein VEN81_09325, partial [Planctomycetota bacterium]|nr:hypothetical protein [Planctomycetota bacterium]